MRDLRTSAAYRIAFTYSAVFIAAIILLGAVVYFAADASFRHQQDASIAKETSDLVRSYRDEGLPELLETVSKRVASSSTSAFGYALFDTSGRRIAGSLVTSRPPAGWSNITFRDPREGPDPARALSTPLTDGKLLVVALDTEALETIDRTILGLFAGALLLFVAVGIAGALLLGGYLRNRLERVSDTAFAIVAGDMGRRIPVGPRGDEFDRLASSLNSMLDRITLLLENLRQVSSDVAHDLRTPLSRLRGELESALVGPADLEAYRKAVERALERSDELLALFAAILRISEVEGGALAASFGPVDLSGLIADLCDSYVPAVSDEGRALHCDVVPGIRLWGDRELIAQAVINLLDNAQRHTPPDTHITVELKHDVTGNRLVVADNGPGVAPEDRDRIVRRFVRLQDSRTTPGHGLGLNLVAAIVAAHGGTLSFADNRPGLRAIIHLPRFER